MNDFVNGGIGYNVRKYHYVDGVQVRMYTKTIVSGKSKKQVNEIENDDEVIIKEKLTEDIIMAKARKSDNNSLNRTIQSIYGIARANRWEYFITLTIDPKKIDSTDYDLVTKKSCVWIMHLKSRKAFDLKYILVPELHKDGSKWHVHGLIAECQGLDFVDSGLVDTSGNTIYNLNNWKYGFSTATKIVHSGRASSYIIKYINKDLVSRSSGKRRYWASKNCLRASDCLEVDSMTEEEKELFLLEHASKINYMKVAKCEQSGQTVKYIELGVE